MERVSTSPCPLSASTRTDRNASLGERRLDPQFAERNGPWRCNFNDRQHQQLQGVKKTPSLSWIDFAGGNCDAGGFQFGQPKWDRTTKAKFVRPKKRTQQGPCFINPTKKIYSLHGGFGAVFGIHGTTDTMAQKRVPPKFRPSYFCVPGGETEVAFTPRMPRTTINNVISELTGIRMAAINGFIRPLAARPTARTL